MQLLIKLVLLSVLLCLLPSESIAQKSGRRTRKPSLPPVICKIASVPNGMVVVGYKRNSACSDGAELLVKRPENGDIICAESPVPPGFSIAEAAQGFDRKLPEQSVPHLGRECGFDIARRRRFHRPGVRESSK